MTVRQRITNVRINRFTMIFLVPWSMMIATALLRPSQVDHIVGLLNHLVVAQHQRLSDRDAAPGCQSTATRDTLKRASLSSSRLGNQHRADERMCLEMFADPSLNHLIDDRKPNHNTAYDMT